MTKQLKAAIAMMLVFGTLSLHAQTTTTKPPAKTKAAKTKPETAEQRAIRELQAQMAAQQVQIDALTRQLADKNAALAETQSTAATAQSQAAAATTQAQTAAAAAQSAAAATQAQAADVTTLKSTVTDLQTSNAGLATTISSTKAEMSEKIESPTTLHYKGVTITPVAFFAFEGVWRQHSVNSDINTPFNSIPFPSATEGHVSELNFSGRQSRLGVLIEGNTGPVKLTGYAETDFLGTGTSSNNNQSDSYVLRQRQIWGQAATKGGFAITGGQMWSLVTENGKATNNRTEKLPNTIDPQYLVGYSWTRQPAIRVQQTFNASEHAQVTMAVSAEQAQITNFNVASSVTAAIPTNFFFGGPGQNGGLFDAAGNIGNLNTASTGGITTYANNLVPDFMFKTALDLPKAHIEIGGLSRFMRDYYFPIATATGSATAPVYTYQPNYISNTKAAGGFFGSVRVTLDKYVDVAFQTMAGTGVGRYGSSQLSDATLRPDGTLEPIKNYHSMFSLETHPTPKLDVFAYYGGEYDQRTLYTTAQGSIIGYGSRQLNDSGCYNLPANPNSANGSTGSITAINCTSPTRYIQEAMGGFTYRFINSPKYGRLQYSFTYSYLQRNLWSGNNIPASGPITSPTGARATDPMLHVGMRYYIP